MKVFMRKIYPLYLLLILAFLYCNSSAESFIVPSEFNRDRVIILTSVNDSRPLRLILDTGMGFDGVYLFDKNIAEEIGMDSAVAARVPGFGTGEPSKALMIEHGCLKFDDIHVDSQRVLVSLSDLTQQFRTDGVIGGSLFGHYTVEIDYNNEQVILHDTADFRPDSGWTVIPLAYENNLPIFECSLEVIAGDIIPVKMNIDIGYKDALELVLKPDYKYKLPDDLDSTHVGTGLSGEVSALIGKSHSLNLAGYVLHDIPTAFAPWMPGPERILPMELSAIILCGVLMQYMTTSIKLSIFAPANTTLSSLIKTESFCL